MATVTYTIVIQDLIKYYELNVYMFLYSRGLERRFFRSFAVSFRLRLSAGPAFQVKPHKQERSDDTDVCELLLG